MRIGRKSKDVDDDAAMALSDLPQAGEATASPSSAVPLTSDTYAAAVADAHDARDLVLCDAHGVARARLSGFKGFRVTHDGVIYEHCATDEAGRWHYRPM